MPHTAPHAHGCTAAPHAAAPCDSPPPPPRSNKVWAEALKEKLIKEEKPTGHPKCTRCEEINTDLIRYKGRMDDEGKALYAQALADQTTHHGEHRGERDYADDWWAKGEMNPEHVTAFSMDAPTERQFDIPVQARSARDTVKALEGARRWSSKITGLMIAGLGILAYVTRAGLGSGGDLSCTVLYLAMCEMIKNGRPLGQRVNVLLDNTAGDNKNNEVLAFLAWLVALDVIMEGSTFFMLVDHTSCRLDQSFRALIGHLLSEALHTPIALVQAIFRFLNAYNCLGVHELHCIWDWKTFFQPHIHQRFSGFCTSQFGAGMHEFVLRKDRDGVVRLWVRQSSQASSWLPDGDGYPVFKNTIPTGPPPLRAGKEDSQWSRAEVQNNIQAWFRFMPLQPAELTRVRTQWQETFDSLPVNGDMSTLPGTKMLPWFELPRVATSRAPQVPRCCPTAMCMEGAVGMCAHACILLHTRPNNVCVPVHAEICGAHTFQRAREPGRQSSHWQGSHCCRCDLRAEHASRPHAHSTPERRLPGRFHFHEHWRLCPALPCCQWPLLSGCRRGQYQIHSSRARAPSASRLPGLLRPLRAEEEPPL